MRRQNLILNITHVSDANIMLPACHWSGPLSLASDWLLNTLWAEHKIRRTEMYLNMAIQDVSKHHHHPPDAAWNTIRGDALKIICN